MRLFLIFLFGSVFSEPTIVEIDETGDYTEMKQRQSVYCAQKCASSLRTGVLAALGTHSTPYSSLLAPFHHIFSNTINTGHSLRKSEYTCRLVATFEEIEWDPLFRSVFHFDTCLSHCARSIERDTWMQAISHWTLFCSLIKQSSRAVTDYIECESEHMREVVHQCGHLNIYPQSSFATFCRLFDKYHRCYERLKHNCTEPGAAVKQQIDEAVERTFERLLKLNSNRVRIPNRCTAWTNHAGDGNHIDGDQDVQIESPMRSSPHRSTDSHIGHQVPVLREAPTELPTENEESSTAEEIELITVPRSSHSNRVSLSSTSLPLPLPSPISPPKENFLSKLVSLKLLSSSSSHLIPLTLLYSLFLL